MQVTDKLEIRVSRNFAGKEPTLVIKEEKTKKTRQVKSSLCSWRDLRGSAVLFLRRSRGKSGYNFSQLEKKVTSAPRQPRRSSDQNYEVSKTGSTPAFTFPRYMRSACRHLGYSEWASQSL